MNDVSAGITAEELDDLAWALADAFPEVEVNLSGAQDFWEAKATQLLPVINKLRDKARAEGRGVPFDEIWDSATADLADQAREYEEKRGLGREITLDEALEKADDPGS